MIASASRDTSSYESPYIWRGSFLRALGLFGPGFMYVLQGVFGIWSGALHLGLMGPSIRGHNTQSSHDFGILGLVLGSALISVGVFVLWSNFNGKAI